MNIVGTFSVIFFHYKLLCKKGETLNEPAVNYQRPSESNALNDSSSNDLSEVRIVPRFVSNISTITGHSKALSRYEENVRAKNSVIILPFCTSTPKHVT